MKLSTPVPVLKLTSPIDYNSKVVLLGSCFTENIGSKLSYYGFDTTINPFGIIFNSTSLRVLIDRAIHHIPFTREDIEGDYSYLAHSDLNNKDQQQLLDQLNNALKKLETDLKQASHLFITLGTAWVYRHIDKDIIVANCHKQPQQLFTKELLTTETINTDLTSIYNWIKKVNAKINITYTLSPVRHIKDGFIENTRSKSRLHDAIQTQVDLNKATYFPAYEIAMDELRDYRFYARDMVHLNEIGVDFIWSRFRESGLNNNTLTQQKTVEKYRKLSQHRATDVKAHQLQIEQMRAKINSQYPEIKL
ncbi:GSCFA domain-containing protein [Nonlabens sp.]|uniref:GSCFA domain-containing protein n=1 Tax=Nonlabens sp. TaxID=1888209 RepID=UPI003265F2C0